MRAPPEESLTRIDSDENDAIGIGYPENLIRHEADLKEWGLGDEFAAVTKKGLR